MSPAVPDVGDMPGEVTLNTGSCLHMGLVDVYHHRLLSTNLLKKCKHFLFGVVISQLYEVGYRYSISRNE